MRVVVVIMVVVVVAMLRHQEVMMIVIVFLRDAHERRPAQRPDTSGRNKPNRSDAGLPASRRAGVGVRGQSPRVAVS